MFRSAGEHPVWFICALGDEIVDQYTDVGFIATQGEWRFVVDVEVCVDSSEESLAGCLFVARGPVDLSCEVEPFEWLCL